MDAGSSDILHHKNVVEPKLERDQRLTGLNANGSCSFERTRGTRSDIDHIMVVLLHDEIDRS